MALGGFFSRLKEGLSRSTHKLSGSITAVFKKLRLDDEALEELEELLISADLGTEAARRVIAAFRRSRFGKEVTDEEIKQTPADLGTEAARRVIAAFRRSRFGKEVTDEEIKQALAEEITAILAPVARPLELNPALKPHVVLVVGVNGPARSNTIVQLGQT